MKRLIPLIAVAFIRLLNATLRVRHVHGETMHRLPQYIIAFWHEHLLLMLHSQYRRPARVLVSQSRDGELIASTFAFYGIEVSRGSSTRGSIGAMREMIREARSGVNIVFTPDGPKGPRRVVKEGLIFAAQMTGLPIVPVVFASKKKSGCTPGTAWSCRTRFRGPSLCTASRC